jgi:sodium-coupled monocarboxylate transporter 8/12
MFEFNPDVADRANFFAACAYGVFVYVAAQATGQSSVQRYVSMPSVSAARWSLVVNGTMTAAGCLVFFLVGSALFAFYQQHPAGPEEGDPAAVAAAKASPGSAQDEGPNRAFPKLKKQDQITPHFIQTQLRYPGLLGLLLAGLFAAVMSSLDSSANSITSLIACDWLPRGRELNVNTTKLLCGAIGLLAIGAALVVPLIGENVFDILTTIAGAFFGPMMGLFVLGMFTRRANSRGAAIGFCAGVCGLVGAILLGVSSWWYGAFTCVPTIVVGLTASLCFAPPTSKQTADLTVFPD